MASNELPIRYGQARGIDRVGPNDGAVVFSVEPGKRTELYTENLVGCTAVAGYILKDDGSSMVGLSHWSVGVDTVHANSGVAYRSVQFMHAFGRLARRQANARTARVMVATMLMEPGMTYPHYNNRELVEAVDEAAESWNELARGDITMARVPYRRGYFTSDTSHSVGVAVAEGGLRITLGIGEYAQQRPVHTVETVFTPGQAEPFALE